ncbi:MAG: Hpt domain-containing protein [Pseudomonadota bacterium]
MREAIDYNALSWIRQEVGVSLKQARVELEEYAERDQRKELLQGCAAHLHEARGPLQMVSIKGADMLACEMEEAIADLLLDSVVDRDSLLEQLMQGFLELPEYLSNLRSGRRENPRQLFPLINSMRTSRGQPLLQADAVFSPDLTASMPAAEFDPGAVQQGEQDVVGLARAARVRFQSGLLEWYRDSTTNHGLQMLVEVMEHLQQQSRTEAAARMWWVAAGVAELLRDGAIGASPVVKRLFGQLDRQIKRLMDSGEAVFGDALSEDLLTNLLLQVAAVSTESRRVNEIRSTVGITAQAGESPSAAELPDIGDELLLTVSSTARESVDRIKDQVDGLVRGAHDDAGTLVTVADSLHALGNTLDMIGMDRLGKRLADEERQLRQAVEDGRDADSPDFTDLANTLVAVEDALADIGALSSGADAVEDRGEAVLRQGQQAVINAVITDIGAAKDAINEFLQGSGDFSRLAQVPVLLNKICGGLELVGEERLAAAAGRVREFIAGELLTKQRQLQEPELDNLADAICSIEYCVEELGENHRYGERAIGVAMESLERLGYAVTDQVQSADQAADVSAVTSAAETVQEDDRPVTADHAAVPSAGGSEPAPAEPAALAVATDPEHTAMDGQPGIGNLQVVAPDADSEIVEIFIEEAGEVLDRLTVDIPAWIANPDDRDMLAEIRRAFHTIKGSGRMIGAMAAGELAWAYENLLNRLLEGVVPTSADVLELVGEATPALKDLVAQVSNPDTILLRDINALGRKAKALSQAAGPVPAAAADIAAAPAPVQEAEQLQDAAAPAAAWPDAAVPERFEEAAADSALPVLKQGADEEIVEIFLEEAAEELTTLSLKIPEWIQNPEDDELLADIRRSLHTLKGSGRMAGAMRAGEFACSMETMLNKVIEGTVSPGGSLYTLLSQVPGAVAGLLRQIQDGIAPDADIDALMRKADELSAMPAVHAAWEPAGDVPVVESLAADVSATDTEADDDAVLLDLYTNECREHLDALTAGIPETAASGMIAEAQYRALHTLSGISESASVPGIGRVAAALYEYFGTLYEENRPAGPQAVCVLEDCVREMQEQLLRLPDRGYDAEVVAGLVERIAGLPIEVPAADSVAGMEGEDLALELAAATEFDALTDTDGQVETVAFDDIPELPAAAQPVAEAPASVADADVEGRELAEERAAAIEYEALAHTDGEAEADAFDDIPELPAAALPLPEAPAAESVAGTASQDQAPELAAGDEYLDLAQSDGHTESAAFDDMQESSAAAAPLATEEEAGGDGLVATAADARDETVAVQEDVRAATSVEMPGADIYADMDQELYEIFVEEATEIVDSSETALRNWSESPDDREQMADFQRLLHTLKGGARMVDITAIGDLSHALESLLTLVADNVVPANDGLFGLLQESHDRLAEMLEKVRSRSHIDAAADLEARLEAFKRGEAETLPDNDSTVGTSREGPPAAGFVRAGERAFEDTLSDHVQTEHAGSDYDHGAWQDQHDDDEADSTSDTGHMAQAMSAQPVPVERRKEGRARGELVRVQAEVLDNLVNNAGEINIYRARMEQQISNFRFNLTELDQTISRLRDQLRQLEIETEAQILFRYEQEAENTNQDFDPLELDRYSKLQQLSRSLIESISDLRSLQALMDMTTRDSETLLLQQSRVSTDLQEALIRTRMIPFAGLAPRLRRIVRQSARQLNKKVDLHLRGAEGEMDRAVIERIVAPLEHMLRNAVAHGIESPGQRRHAGKRDAGSITIELSREGNEIVLRISDDGAGLDIDAIRKRAIERGLMDRGVDLPDSDVMQFVLQTGFSTASEVTQISGRGVGMDVVNSEVKQLGGSLHIDSETGRGSLFTIRLPYTLAINQALLITAGDQIFCVPMSSIEGVVTASAEQLQSCYADATQEFGYAGHSYQLMHLGSLLGINRNDLENAGNQIPVLLVRVGEKRIGVQIDSLLGSREVVIKPLGAQLSMVDGITGATILGDGRVVMILDMFAVSRMKVREQEPLRPAGTQDDSRLVIMVVDDSITVRKVTSRLLERSGYRVLTAKDGVDAMGQLQEIVPDMMLLDIEMPRMDGFELATHMRNDERLKHVPIIMITSRTGDKHRERAFEIGVNEYLGKPYQESELLASINKIIGVNTLAVGG